MTYHPWITDTTVDDGQGWPYGYKTLDTLIHYLVDNVSKNGYMLLNVGPKPEGTIPDEGKELRKGTGRWMDVNSEAIYLWYDFLGNLWRGTDRDAQGWLVILWKIRK